MRGAEKNPGCRFAHPGYTAFAGDAQSQRCLARIDPENTEPKRIRLSAAIERYGEGLFLRYIAAD
jgi:hypothetical protein